jgi:lipopolysaccharide export system permease protein
MSILNKIIIKSWLIFFFSATAVLMFVLSLGNFLGGLLSSKNEFIYVFYKLIYDTPMFMVKIFPVSCLIASLFSLNQLKNRNELTAIFASGYSRKKFIYTLSLLGLSVGIFLFYINSYLVPYTRGKAFSELKQVGKSSITRNAINSGRIWFKGSNYFVSYVSFDSNRNKINEIDLLYFNANFKITEEVKAKYATFLDNKNWELHNVTHITNLENPTFPALKYYPIKNWNLEESIQDFKKINADIATLSIWKLYDYIQVLSANGLNSNEYMVSFLDKFSSSFTCIILSLLSAIAVFNPNRRNSSFGLNVSFVLGFTFLYWFIYSYFITLGQTSKVHPIIATFGVPSIFSLYLLFFFLYHRKLR